MCFFLVLLPCDFICIAFTHCHKIVLHKKCARESPMLQISMCAHGRPCTLSAEKQRERASHQFSSYLSYRYFQSQYAIDVILKESSLTFYSQNNIEWFLNFTSDLYWCTHTHSLDGMKERETFLTGKKKVLST